MPRGSLIEQDVVTAPRSQRVLALWVTVVNAGGAGKTLLLSNRDPSPPALDAWLAGACLAAAGCLLLPAGCLKGHWQRISRLQILEQKVSIVSQIFKLHGA